MAAQTSGNWKRDLAEVEAEFPSQEELNEDPDFNRAMAPQYAAQLQKVGERISQISVDLQKWVLTSLQAINAGGAIALTQTNLPIANLVWSGVSFTVGLLLPLLSAHLSSWGSIQHSLENGRMVGYWQGVALNGYRVRETEMELLALPQNALNRGRWPRLLGWASTALFVCGALGVGFGLAGQ